MFVKVWECVDGGLQAKFGDGRETKVFHIPTVSKGRGYKVELGHQLKFDPKAVLF
jgi:hypothetical protein